ncbi:MAG: PH domain-containing protein [Bacteroides sp.]|nr:PH domain-containing protein [Bacteroides sp.]
MDRIFHARIAWYNYMYLLILGGTLVFLLWEKHGIPAALLSILLIILIERIIHTTYTVTADNRVVTFYGRFSRKRTVPIELIRSVHTIRTFTIGNFSMAHYLLVKYQGGFISLLPVKEEEFVALLHSRNPSIQIDPDPLSSL